jgi:hypothetical protein
LSYTIGGEVFPLLNKSGVNMVSDDKLKRVAQKLWADIYEEEFRGKSRGRFALRREQLREALDVERLHASTVRRLQDVALKKGLVIIDLDDIFPCVEADVLRRYRRPPGEVFNKFFGDDAILNSGTDDDDDPEFSDDDLED